MEYARIWVDLPLILIDERLFINLQLLITKQQLSELWSYVDLACKTVRFCNGEQPVPLRQNTNAQIFGLSQNFLRNKEVLL